jgi:hypothetical protein
VLYENVGPLTAASGVARIYAPIAYSIVRSLQVVPIVHIEAVAVASWFPICWRVDPAGCQLVALRSLYRDGSHQPVGSPESASSLPLILRAYPFVVESSPSDGDQVMLEASVPDRPTDVGATILTSDGKPGRGADLRLRAVAGYRSALPFTQELTRELEKRDMLEPWPLNLESVPGVDPLDDLKIVRQSTYDSPAMFQFIRKFGPAAAIFLGAHRISLFRAGNLFQAAKSTNQKAEG